MYTRPSRAGSKIAAVAGLFSLPLTVAPAFAVCLWADVGGEKLGVVGRITGPYNTDQTTLERTLDLDTQSTGQAVFFGYVANQVKLTRKGQDGRDHVYDFGTVAREMTGGGWTKHGDLSGKHAYQPSWMLMQSPLVTRVYACQPHKGSAGDFRMSGGQGAEWSTNPQPWINDVKYYRDTRVRMEVSGYGVVWQGVNYNFVSIIRVDDRWPCEIMKDFSLPRGAMAVKGAKSGNSVDIQWDTEWGCGTGGGSGPETSDVRNRPPTVTLKATPDRGEPTLTATFTATGIDPDGDPVEYRFKPPGGKWTEWGPGNSITASLSSKGVHTAEVQVTDIKGAPASARATVTLEDPVWDALVLYRNMEPLWQSHVAGSGAGWATNLGDKREEELRRERQKDGRGAVKATGDLIGLSGVGANGTNHKEGTSWMKGPAMDMALWAWDNQHARLTGMITGKDQRDAIIILSRRDEATGRTEYRLGLWDNFTDKAGYPLGDRTSPAAKFGLQELKGNWQASDGKSRKIGGESYRINVVGYQYSSTPVILDLAGRGEPDLLAGVTGWRRERPGGVKEGALREFDMDGSGDKLWEWAGPTAGILVWGGGNSGPVKADRLFGSKTWGRDWKDGYQPLEALDADKNGALEGDEMKDIHVWVDANTNAVNEPGEIRRAADLDIVSISAAAERDEKGNAWAKSGFAKKDGTTGASWDWWSRGRDIQPNEVKSGGLGKPSVYGWRPMEEGSEIPGGIFMFSQGENEELTLLSLTEVKEGFQDKDITHAMLGLAYKIQKDGNRLRWKSVNGDTEIANTAVLEGNTIVGSTRMTEGGREIGSYKWVALHGSGAILK
jgi:hypothetical protein